MSGRGLTWSCAAGAMVCLGVAGAATGPAPEPVERSYLTTFRGEPYSVLTERVTRELRNGHPVRVVRSEERIRLVAAGKRVEQRIRRRRVEEAGGAVISYHEVLIDHSQRRELRVRREGEEYVFTSSLTTAPRAAGAKGPVVRNRRLRAPGKVLFELDGRALARQGRLQVGGRLEAYVLAIAEEGIARLEARVLGRRRTARAGVGSVAYLVEVGNAGHEAPTVSWQLLVAADGELLEMYPAPGLVRRRVAKSQARLPRRAATISGALRTAARVKDLERVSSMDIELRIPGNGAPAALSSGVYQEVSGGARGTASGDARLFRLHLKATWPDGRLAPLGTGPSRLDAAVRARFLAPSLLIQSDAPQIAALAARITAGRNSQMKCAYALAAWVEHNLHPLPIGPVAGSALEAYHSRSGDCTEHTALLCALARASGIPARPLSGLVHDQGAFRFHAWSELYLSGRWVPVDATLGRFGLPALYIAFGDGAAARPARPAWAVALQAGGSMRILGVRH